MYNKPISAAIFACMMFLFFPNFVGADEAAIKSGEKKEGKRKKKKICFKTMGKKKKRSREI